MLSPHSVASAAKRTGLSPCRIRQLIADGSIPAFRPGGRRLMIETAALEAFIESRKVQPVAAVASQEAQG